MAYSTVMGRARKWSSEAERLRDYRARKKLGLVGKAEMTPEERLVGVMTKVEQTVGELLQMLRDATDEIVAGPSAFPSTPRPINPRYPKNWNCEQGRHPVTIPRIEGGPRVCVECGQEVDYFD